jgi:3'-phosphoadenosine 5'-phosphosulfate sulfotransferase (PAPS reductase)/FAD synthetase
MNRLTKLEDQSKAFVERLLPHYNNPAIMCSFGKDSMVMLHLMRKWGYKLPIIFHRDPWWPQKYRFADEVAALWDLEVYDYPPSAITMWEGESIMAFTNHYQIGAAYLQLPKNILEPEQGRRWLCGVDLLNRPKGTFSYPWDLVLIGHKSSDEDQIAGKVVLHVDVKKNAGAAPDAAFPLKEWTDEDVWDYTEEHDVPQQWDRYEKGARKELPDKWTNSDYANVCIACIDCRSKEPSVWCPKLEMQVSNIADKVAYDKPTFNYYGNASD